MKFDMHCHTKEGSLDGKVTIEDTIRILKEKGFDGMLVSDHNSYRGYRYYKKNCEPLKDFVVLRGIEYDTLDCGHILVILPTGVRVPLIEIRGLPVSILIDVVHHYGGILGPAHPFGERFLSITHTRRGRRKEEIYKKFDFFETHNACETPESNAKAKQLATHFNRPQFGGSDSHKDISVGFGYTIIPVPIANETDLIEAVRKRENILSGGDYFCQTTKDKLGPFNKFLVWGFWFYNTLCAGCRFRKRRIAFKEHQLSSLTQEDAPN